MNYRHYPLKIILLLGLVGCLTTASFAQISDVSKILQAATNDANALTKAYLKPFGSGFGASLNTGWTNTAKPHRTLGFDLTLSTGLAIVPEADKTFDVTELGLQQLEHEDGPQVSQTISGSNETGSTLAAYADPDGPGGISEQKFLEFTMPEGTNFGYVPAPMVKGAVGIIKDTEIMFRYLPEQNIENYGSFKMHGFGLKHGINQWLPAGNLLPVDLSLMFGYSNLDVGSDLEITAQDVIQDPDNTENPYSPSQWEGQRISMTTDAWTINALVGKTLPVISVYGGLGYEASTFSIASPGSYPTVIPNEAFEDDPQNNEPFIVDAVDDPINMSIDGENGFHALAGFRLRFAVFHISGSYTLSNYSSYNLRVGISFR